MSATPEVLVCGGGLLGGAIAGRLAGHHAVTVVDRNPELKSWQAGGVEFVEGDLTDSAWLRDRRPVCCVYAAGSLPQAFAADAEAAHNSSVDAFAGFLRFAAFVKPHVVLCSSLAVYGERIGGATEETPVAPVTPYGRAKATLETMVTRVAQTVGFPYTVLRFCGIVGPVTHPGGGWMQRLLAETVTTRPDDPPAALAGQEYLYVDDAAQSVELVVKARAAGVFNVGSGVVPTVAELRGGDSGPARRRVLGSAKIRAAVGYRPRFDTFGKVLEGVRHGSVGER